MHPFWPFLVAPNLMSAASRLCFSCPRWTLSLPILYSVVYLYFCFLLSIFAHKSVLWFDFSPSFRISFFSSASLNNFFFNLKLYSNNVFFISNWYFANLFFNPSDNPLMSSSHEFNVFHFPSCFFLFSHACCFILFLPRHRVSSIITTYKTFAQDHRLSLLHAPLKYIVPCINTEHCLMYHVTIINITPYSVSASRPTLPL